MKTVIVRLPDPLDARLSKVARKKHMKKAAFVREVLIDLLGHENESSEVSCLDLAADLIGCAKGGARDLSANKRHMRGYGR